MSPTKVPDNTKPDLIVNVVTPLTDEFHFDRLQVHLKKGKCGNADPLIPTFDDFDEKQEFSLRPSPKFAMDEDAFESMDLLSSSAESLSNRVHEDEGGDVWEAAAILCKMRDDVKCAAESTIVDMTVEMLLEKQDYDEMQTEDEEFKHDDEEADEAICMMHAVDGDTQLLHPDRLAIDEDADEVNKLHQFVRKDLLEIFVVPQVCASSDDIDDEEEDDDDDETTSSLPGSKVFPNMPNTRGSAVRRCSSMNSTGSLSTQKKRHYPGRVGLRCVHCANTLHKATTKAAFYPLRLKNIYREVCAWQRIHFKKCPMVPSHVREKYDHLKEIDLSRGKVRYWESAARKIGLENNPDREDGIVFTDAAWKA